MKKFESIIKGLPDLRGLENFPHIITGNVEGFRFEEVVFDCRIFKKVNFHDCAFYRCVFLNIDFKECIFTGNRFILCHFEGTKFYKTKISSVISNCDMINLSFREVDLTEADIDNTNLQGSTFHQCEFNPNQPNRLRSIDLYGAEFHNCKGMFYFPMACPDSGAFIGWKKVRTDSDVYIIKLKIPASAKRSSATSDKCRCSKAKVLSITKMDGEKEVRVDRVMNRTPYRDLCYVVGHMVYPDKFDPDRWNECSHGIHFFINKQDAINY